MNFAFKEDGCIAQIFYGNDTILTLAQNYMPFGGQFSVHDQWMKPGAGPEVAHLPLFACHGYRNAVTEVRYETQIAPNELTLRVFPTMTRTGTDVFGKVREVCTMHVRLDQDRFIWRQQMHVEILKDLDITQLNNKTDVRVYRFWDPQGQPGCYMQFADPMPVGASGPAVPMTRDWVGIPEPTVGSITFRQNWQRRYVSIIFADPDGGYSWSELNKRKFHFLTADNQRARACDPDGTLFLVNADSTALAYQCSAPSHYHHICEWGMDFHCWLDLKPFLQGDILPAGTEIKAQTIAQLVEPETVQPILQQARYIDLTPDERRRADVPAYEEPESTLTVSALDRLDAQYWIPAGEGCSWTKTGGYRSNSGCLIIENNFSSFGQWRQEFLGPSHYANPFVPGARYCCSAWVKLQNLSGTMLPQPQLSVEFKHYHGPATVSPCQIVPGGTSPPIMDFTQPFRHKIEWTYLELITEPCPSYTLGAVLTVSFRGYGQASFSNIRWELIPAQ